MPLLSQSFDLGVHYFLHGEYSLAFRAFQGVVQEEPLNSRAWSYLGMTLAHLGRGAEAERALTRAVELSPENGEAWFHLGVARSLREEWGEAASAYRHAVALEPTDMVAWHRLGVALAESGEEPAATAAFERALVLSREEDDLGTPEEIRPGTADSHLSEAAEREGSREAASWLDLGLALLSLGEEEEAVAAYERAYTLDPERARRSLFRPMLQLLTAAQEPGTPIGSAPPTMPRPRPTQIEPPRPEVG